MRVPDEVLKCVVFLGVTQRSDTPGTPSLDRYAGTAFIVGVESERHPEGTFTYLVAAAHTIDKIEGDCWARVNVTGGGTRKIDIGAKRWARHPEGNRVDVAVLPWHWPKDMDQLAVPTKMMLVTPEMFKEKGIGVGDEVFMTGVFASASGTARNTPIVRSGNLAMLPDDRVPTKDLKDIDAYLVETHSLGGISGAPAFARETLRLKVGNDMLAGVGAYYFIGLIHGHWEIDDRDINDLYFRSAAPDKESVNLGISIVIPASKILEVLMLPEFVDSRRRADQQIAAGIFPAGPAGGTSPQGV